MKYRSALTDTPHAHKLCKELVDAGKTFTVAPHPNGVWEIEVKSEPGLPTWPLWSVEYNREV